MEDFPLYLELFTQFLLRQNISGEVSLPSLMSTFTRRDRLAIFAEILETTGGSRDGENKTKIMRSVHLSYPQVKRYLNLLLINGLLHRDSDDRYKPTKKGLEFIRTLKSHNPDLK